MNKDLLDLIKKLTGSENVKITAVQQHPIYDYDVVTGEITLEETVMSFKLPCKRGRVSEETTLYLFPNPWGDETPPVPVKNVRVMKKR